MLPLFLTMIQNLIWNHTRLQQHQFASQLTWGRTTFIMLTNLLGIVLTLGSDASPAVGRHQFLAGWRLVTGLGQAAGPLLVSGLAAVASLSAAALTVGAIGLLGGAWLWYWVGPPPRRE